MAGGYFASRNIMYPLVKWMRPLICKSKPCPHVLTPAFRCFDMQLGAMFATDPDVVELTSYAVPALAISLIGEFFKFNASGCVALKHS